MCWLSTAVNWPGDGVQTDTGQVRAGEELNIDGLTRYLCGKIDGAERGIAVEQFAHGHSNLTYLLKIGERECVLRRGPLGPVAPKAHDMARECRVLQAVHPQFPEAPEALHLCEDAQVIGAVFFLMERRHGVVLRSGIPEGLREIEDHAPRISEAFIRCLVRLHAIDVSQTGLTALGKPDGFLGRQVQGWAERWRRAQTEENPEVNRVIQWLEDHLPVSPAPTLVHNDYKLDNVMLPLGMVDRVEAVLDWEMTTVGDPLADVGLTLAYWAWAPTIELQGDVASNITVQPGWYSRDRFVERYTELSGRDVSQIGYYEVLGLFKLAVILQQIYFRFRRGQTQDSRFQNFGELVTALGALAAALAIQSRHNGTT